MGGRVEGKLVQSAEHSVAVTATELGECRGRHHRQHKLCRAPNRWPAGRHKRQCDAARYVSRFRSCLLLAICWSAGLT